MSLQWTAIILLLNQIFPLDHQDFSFSEHKPVRERELVEGQHI